MKLKLSSAEFLVLHDLLQRICIGIKPKGIQAHVLHGVLFRLFKKFYKKAIETKHRYTVSIEADEACAFYMFFTNQPIQNEETFTINLIHQINTKIHQTYSV